MLKLPFFNFKYISPSTFLLARECSLSGYLQKYSASPITSGATRPMSIGSAFDSFVKAELAKQLGETKAESFLMKLLESVDMAHRDLIPIGKKLAEDYIEQGCIKRLLDDGLSTIELDYKDVEIQGVPVRCKPDALLRDGTPVDWKVNGFESNYGGSVHDGFIRRVYNCVDWGPDRNNRNKTLDEIDEKWAVQLLFYWQVANPNNHSVLDAKGQIEQICIKPAKTTYVTYRSAINPIFVTKVWNELKTLWANWSNGEIPKPTPSSEICTSYRRVKPCAPACPFYQKTLGSGANIMDRVMNS